MLEHVGGPVGSGGFGIPLGSDWGGQPEMTFRMKAGDPVQQWMFEDKGEFYYLWFAKVSYADDDPWRVTLKKKMSRRIAA